MATLHGRSRHMVENEMVFREYNERIQRGFDELKQLARQEGRSHLNYQDDSALHFYCECSDENCKDRILIKPSVYTNIHESRERFIVVEGHDVPSIERIVHRMPGYYVIEKMTELPAEATIHSTDVDNT